MGPGKARYKEVRFLARDPRDPAGEIERRVRMEKLEASGAAVGGSYLGLVPPFPRIERWVQGSRTSWDDKGLVPQVLLLWSIQQNDLIRLDPWLAHLAKRFADVGLELVSVCSPNDSKAVDAYLEEHPFPGAVAVDHREGVGMGSSYDLFAIERFNLPRLLLLDIDGKVIWEGDPGFKIGEAWTAELESFLEAPLEELIVRRKLRELAAWTKQWRESIAQELALGSLDKAWPAVQAAKAFDGSIAPLAYDVQRLATALEAAFAELHKSASALDKAGRGAAAPALIAWAQVAGVTLDKRATAQLKPLVEGAQAKEWERALKLLETAAPKLDKAPDATAELLAKLTTLKGPFAAELAADVREATGDSKRLAELLREAPRRPARWLIREHFRWK